MSTASWVEYFFHNLLWAAMWLHAEWVRWGEEYARVTTSQERAGPLEEISQQATLLYWQVGSWFLTLSLLISNLSLPLVVCFSNASSHPCLWPSFFQWQPEPPFLCIKPTYFNNSLVIWIAVLKINTFTRKGIVQRGRKSDLVTPR